MKKKCADPKYDIISNLLFYMFQAEFNSTMKIKLTTKVNTLQGASVLDRAHFIVRLMDLNTNVFKCVGTIYRPSKLITASSCVDDRANYPEIHRNTYMNIGPAQVHTIESTTTCPGFSIVHVSRIRKKSR